MRAVAYCRVSTNKDEQLDSLEAQRSFFAEYAVKNHFELVGIYADEGKSGTKIRNRTQLLRLLADAERRVFDTVLIKDVSRLARNTVDFLTSIRKLKALGIKVVFVNYDQTSSDSSEFMLTMLSAIAQEESANTSRRVKFGKKLNAEKGRVPNLIYGYDKIPGDYFNLRINEAEAAVVRRIFNMYTAQGLGANKIAQELNRAGLRTKRGCRWSQNAVSRILTNEIYIGRIINGKQEVEDFLTGRRKDRLTEEWLVTERPELAVVSRDIFEKAAQILASRRDAFRITGERRSEKHALSKLIKCKCCGASFRRTVRTYRNTFIRWVCTGRNAGGADACPNDTSVDEPELLEAIRNYLLTYLRVPPGQDRFAAEYQRACRTGGVYWLPEKELGAQLDRLRKAREKYREMYINEVISLSELKEKSSELDEAIDRLKEEWDALRNAQKDGGLIFGMRGGKPPDPEILLSPENLTHSLLSGILEKIEVDEHRHVDIYLRRFGETGRDAVHLSDNRT